MSGRPIPPNRRWQRESRLRRALPPEQAHLERLEELLRQILREDPRFQALLEEHLRRAMAIYQAELRERLREMDEEPLHALPRRRPPRRMSLIQRILWGLLQVAVILTLSWGIGTLIERFIPQKAPTQEEQLEQVLIRRASELLERTSNSP